MSTANGSALPGGTSDTADTGKGKGKAVDQHGLQDISMDEDSSEEESGNEEPAAEVEDEDDDNLEEIDIQNIIDDGRRTRGKKIDFAEAAQKAKDAGVDLDDDDDDDDEDFEAKDDEATDVMHE